MAMKCELCKATIGKTFLEKVLGTHVRDAKGKKHLICPQCQKKWKTKAVLLTKL